MTYRICWRWRGFSATFRSLAAFLVVMAVIGCQRGRIIGVTEDSPSNNLSVLLISIFSYENSYNRCPESLSVLGPPPQGHSADSQAANLIASDLASGKHNGYVYEYVRSTHSKSCEFTIHADPVDPRPGQLHYFTDDTGARRFETGRRASATSHEYEKDN